MSLAATTPAPVTGARPDFSSRIVALAAAMASVCLRSAVDLLCADHAVLARYLFFPRMPILAILFFSAVGVAVYGRFKGFAEKWLYDLIESASEQLAAWGEKERSTALYATITVLSGLTLFSRACADQMAGKPVPGLRPLQELPVARVLMRPRHRQCAGAPEPSPAAHHASAAGADHISADLASLREPGRYLLLRAGEGGNLRLRPAQHAAGVGVCGGSFMSDSPATG